MGRAAAGVEVSDDSAKRREPLCLTTELVAVKAEVTAGDAMANAKARIECLILFSCRGCACRGG